MARLARMATAGVSGPIFNVPLSELYGRENGAVPQILVDMIRKLDKSKLHADRVFRDSTTDDRVVHMFRGMYDGGHRRPLQRCFDVYNVAALLKTFLLELPRPLFTEGLVKSLLDRAHGATSQESVSAMRDIVTQIPTCERRTLKYILFYLQRACQQRSICLTNSSRRAVSRIFVPILFKREAVGEECPEVSRLEKILELMIKRSEEVFSPFNVDGAGERTPAPAPEPANLDVGRTIESRIADAVDSLFETSTPSAVPVEGGAEAAPPGAREARRRRTVLREHSLNVVEQKKNPEAAQKKEQVAVKPAVKSDFARLQEPAALDLDDLSYQDLLRLKKKIKKEIRKADGELAKRLGHKPSQLEKEPLRPMYSRYWKIKRALESCKSRRGAGEPPAGAGEQVLELLKY